MFMIWSSPNGEPQEIRLENLADDYYRLNFLVDTTSTRIAKEMEVSLQAGELVGTLYDAILKQYKEQDGETLRKFEYHRVCVWYFVYMLRMLEFLETRDMFHDYLGGI